MTGRGVGLPGQLGAALSGPAGYLGQDGKVLRVLTITLPVVVDDLWSQVA